MTTPNTPDAKQEMKEESKCRTIDAICGQPEGTFAQFCKDHPDIDQYIADQQFKADA